MSQRETRYFNSKLSFPFFSFLWKFGEPIKCENAIFQKKIDDLHKTLDKFTKVRDNLNLIIVNQILTYNKIGRGYEQKNNSKSFSNIFVAKRTSKSSKHKCNYYGKNDHVTLF